MPIAQFGPKKFEVSKNKVCTFQTLSYSTKIAAEKQDAVGKKPTTKIKGPELNQIKITVLLQSNLGVNPRDEINSWEKLQNSAVPYLFILGGKSLGENKYLLKDCTASNFTINKNGYITSAELSLNFEEYLPPGVQLQSGTAASGAYKGSSNISVKDAYQVTPYKPEEKSEMKRANAGVKRLWDTIVQG